MAQAEKEKNRRLDLPILGISRLKLRDLGYIVFRNVFLLTNGIIFAVVALLFVFGDKQAGIFLGIISVFNVLAGLFQDINAWLALEKLQFLTAPRVQRIKDDRSLETVLAEEIKNGDHIKLKIGDQIPSDSILLESNSLEINEGLITGESDSLPRSKGERLLAGSVVTSGTGIILTEIVFQESRIARMTEGIKRYSTNLSPIQQSINIVVKYAGYFLLIVIAFIAARGFIVHEPTLQIVNNVGALSSVLVPAGLVFAVTLLFAYGAAHLFNRQVLLQEVNATEKLGRIKNLCMDKTGTLTENVLVVEKMETAPGVGEDFAKDMAAAYIQGTADSSQTINAIKKFIDREYSGKIAEVLAFSSWRQFGAVNVKNENKKISMLVGSSDVFLPHIANSKEKKWLQEILDVYTSEGKRTLCFVKSNGTSLPHELSDTTLSIVSVFVFFNNLRHGIRTAVDFFQNRGVHIRIISGDNPQTVRSVAQEAGIKNADKVVTGKEMQAWDEHDFNKNVKKYSIFARIVPEQKEKIISAFKKDGFTAMVGDGANDALAIKNADLGIAMFDGAPATRQLASVVLMNNSFAALPGGVELADSIIKNIEIFSGIFFNISFSGFFFFIILTLFGHTFPLTPLNMALINYVAIGTPGILVTYWSIRPSGKAKKASPQSFLKKIVPFAARSAVIQSFGLAAVFALSPQYLKDAQSNTLVLLAFIAFGFVFFAFSPSVYHEALNRSQKLQLFFLMVLESLVLLAVFSIPLLAKFFDVAMFNINPVNIAAAVFVVGITCFFQYQIAKRLTLEKNGDFSVHDEIHR